ncbi:hypothetical protein [Afipia felis]|uniref:Uncharacterized protein n=2 Tax=Afipia felis TaxID=1035 RepID=A0A380W4G3_AFIFE|nr:hypothetical protein [Afipia felis]EKS30274.1 hypothetical protein HMPREF9697_02802 [Afipia felis ATCC 53690]SUU75019.1 Uncharacterised protein [Afipia felis]SUU83085.1 Uncharacterised protein [Afipia felis]
MSIETPELSFTSPLTNNAQLVAMLSALHAAFQTAVVIKADEILAAGVADREERLRLFDAYTDKITKEAKRLQTERFAVSDEAKGVGATLELMGMLYAAIREQL